MLKDNRIVAKKIAIVEDEPTCLIALRFRIERLFPELEIAFEADSLRKTREALKKHTIDLIFLDVQLKDGNAFDLLSDLSENTRVIFTTAHNNFAVHAFEVNALDYLLKPVQDERLKRAIQVFTDHSKRNQTLPLIRPSDEISLQENGITRFIEISKIIFIKAEKDYTHVETTHKPWFIRQTISTWEEKLPALLFIRIHRSYLVNTSYIESVRKETTGCYRIILKGVPEAIVSSRRYGSRLKSLLESFIHPTGNHAARDLWS